MRASLMCPSRGNPFDEFHPLEGVEAYEHDDGWWWTWYERCGGPFPTDEAAIEAGIGVVGADLREEAFREADVALAEVGACRDSEL